VTLDPFLEQIAAMRREIADLKRRLPTYRAATVVAVDPLTSTFTADLPEAGQITGIPSEPQFLPSVGDAVQLDLFGATPVYRPKRLTTWAVAPDGTPYQTTDPGKGYSGTDDADGSTTWQITPDGHQTVQGLTVNSDPVIMGVPLSSYFTEQPSGFHAGGGVSLSTDPALTPVGGGETGLFEMTVELEAGHLYHIHTSNIWVRPSTLDTTRIDLNLRYEVSVDPAIDPPPVTTASKMFTRWPQQLPMNGTIGHGVMLSRLFRPLKYAHFRFLLSLGSSNGQAYIEMGSENFTDAELGVGMQPESAAVYITELGGLPWTNRAVLNSGSSGGATPAAVKRYTYTYYPHWTRRFRGNGTVHTDGGDAVQGYYSLNGDQASQIGDFRRNLTGPSIASDLSGATIEKCEVRLHAKHWHYNAGGTAVIRYHNNTGPGSLNNYAGDTRVGSWGRGEGRWVNMGVAFGERFRDGTAKGIQVGPAGSTDPIFYGTFVGGDAGDGAGDYRPAVRVTFTK
jgi:hypothetical protein